MSEQAHLLVLVPTYNEIDNVDGLIASIFDAVPEADLLFVDDNSPDGTGDKLDAHAAANKHIHVLHRSGKLGVGSAHADGIAWAYERNYPVLVTLDSDGSHTPADIPRFLELADQGEVVVGSRFVLQNSLDEWLWRRKFMTHLGHLMTRLLLGMPYDATGGFRLYRLDKIPQGLFRMVESPSYSFFYESLYRLYVNKKKITELPIRLPARTYGHSKMLPGIVVREAVFLLRFALRARFSRRPMIFDTTRETAAEVRAEWDHYWSKAKGDGKGLYDLIAAFYRRRIIAPAVNHFLSTHFREGSRILHAGSGGGTVDQDMCRHLKIEALDISPKALARYGEAHEGNPVLIEGSILNIPADDASYDGLFNLGVMEHFHTTDLAQALDEFNRILKPGGRVVLFWPPAYGPSVLVLNFVHWVLNRVLRKNIRLHPEEHTLIRRRSETQAWLERAGFKFIDFYFGPRDMFTHRIVVAEKI
jgi:dolichol-phosphate mannosyltransferase